MLYREQAVGEIRGLMRTQLLIDEYKHELQLKLGLVSSPKTIEDELAT